MHPDIRVYLTVSGCSKHKTFETRFLGVFLLKGREVEGKLGYQALMHPLEYY
jgi:hypothetical protein